MVTPRTRAWSYAMIAAMTMALQGYDASTFNSVLAFSSFTDYFKNPDSNTLNPDLIGAVNTAYTCGQIVSGFGITPTLSAFLGRRRCLQLGCSLVIASTFIQVFTPNLAGYIAGRLIMGIGQGIATPIGPTYIAELAPAHIRGMMMSLWQMWYAIGSFIVYWEAYGVSHNPALGNWQWRIPVLCQIVIPSIIIVGMFIAPESPRWLVNKGRIDEAREVLLKVRSPSEAEEELSSVMAAIEYEKVAIDKTQRWYTPYVTLFQEKTLRKRVLIALFINGGQQICGNSVLSSYTSLVYKSVFANPDTIFLINALYGTTAIVFCLSCTFLVERLGRRTLLLIGAVGQGIAILIVAIIGVTTPVDATGHRPQGPGIGIAAMFFVFAMFYKPTWGATVWVYTADMFPTNVRAHAISMSAQTQSVVLTVVNQFFPIFLDKKGFQCFFLFVGINVLLFTGTFFLLPETKGIPLEEMDVLFGGVSHVSRGEELQAADIPYEKPTADQDWVEDAGTRNGRDVKTDRV